MYGSGDGTVAVHDISDGTCSTRANRSVSDRGGAAAGGGGGGGGGGSITSVSCLVGLLAAASFVGVAIGMVFAIDRTVVALC